MRRAIFIAMILPALAATGCRIDQNKAGDGDNVKVATPFGGLQVKTDSNDVVTGIGLPTYPGATMVKKNKLNGKDNGSADVNMSFGSFQLRVKAAEFHTDDSQQKVFDFYKKALGRYGDVIRCEHDQPVGSPMRTREGLACDNDHYPGSADTKGNENEAPSSVNGKVELKAGSKKHQHIVSIHTEGDGTSFGLVALDLPGDFPFSHSGDKDDKDKDGSQ